MSGTKSGGKRAVATILARDPDFYKKIGRKGGSVYRENRGFAGDRELASRAGQIGGTVSRRRRAGDE